jgi:hypothetical protein
MGESVVTVHRFNESLAKGEHASLEPFWESVYRKAFPTMVGRTVNLRGNPAQALGIDHTVLLSSGKTLLIDTKCRFTPYDDILLEYISNDQTKDETKALGWIRKDSLQIDYLAYAWVRQQTVVFLPWIALREAWVQNIPVWWGKATREERGYKKCEAKNPTYSTWSLAVPRAVVLDAVRDALTVTLAA